MIDLLNMDCMDYMAGLPAKAFDLAIVDPPYGIGAGKFQGFESVKRKNGTTGNTSRRLHTQKDWDESIPGDDYFAELMRVSVAQIIWGGNYFDLPPTRGVICWDKLQAFPNFSAWEMAWTSTDMPAKIFRMDNKGFMNPDGPSIHPTQKPVALYEWLLTNYAKPGQRILDTHLGSGSSAIAAHNLGFDFVGTELDADYYAGAVKRLDAHKAQASLFLPEDFDHQPRDCQQVGLL